MVIISDWSMTPERLEQITDHLCTRHDLQRDELCLLVSIAEQRLYCVEHARVLKQYPVSTSRYGAGCQVNSYCTPLGAHRVAEKIGDQCSLGEIIKARVPTGEIASSGDTLNVQEDRITTRILWLRGMEPGINQGEGVDSYHRYIYIHGTPQEELIGQPASIGCVRMKNKDVADLYEQVHVSMLVYITE